MISKVHHINCGSMLFINRFPVVCHVLLIETSNGLVLVDTGFGVEDVRDPTRIGPISNRRIIGPQLDMEETALFQVRRLGYDLSDVRHIILTHLDNDHVGGVADFPKALVHTTAAEAHTAFSGGRKARRYQPGQMPNPERLIGHPPGRETWKGFTNVLPLSQISDGLALVPFPGHTLGHACVAVETGSTTLLHCGDAFYHRGVLDSNIKIPLPIRVEEVVFGMQPWTLRKNHQKLRELYRDIDSNVDIICAHDPEMLSKYTSPDR